MKSGPALPRRLALPADLGDADRLPADHQRRRDHLLDGRRLVAQLDALEEGDVLHHRHVVDHLARAAREHAHRDRVPLRHRDRPQVGEAAGRHEAQVAPVRGEQQDRHLVLLAGELLAHRL